jgi:L-ascorbate metabolism protein UlaG (beta-lactamase superfamily)
MNPAVRPARNGGAVTAFAAFKAIRTAHGLSPEILLNLSGKLKRDRRISGMEAKVFALISVLILASAESGFPAAGQAAVLSGDTFVAQRGNITVHPINHATFALEWNGTTIYVDPVGGAARFKALPAPGLILLTDIHGDHLNKETLEAVAKPDTKIVAPPAVAEQLPSKLRERTTVLTNGQSAEVLGIPVEAIPAYNTTPQRQQFHAKGRGNGYMVALGGKRVYISGDTENTPEMAALKNIDIAFLCMNLPYTMTVEQAADAVRAFKPKVVYPYHSRGSDLEKFKTLVGADAGVEVRLRDWYATK